MNPHTTYQDWHPMDTRDHLESAISRVAARYGIAERRPERAESAQDAPERTNPTHDPCETFGDVLRRLRESRGLSQSRLARLAGVDPSCISRLESCARSATRMTVHEIADALDATPDEREHLLTSAGFAFELEPDVEAFRAYPPELRAKVLELLVMTRGEA